MKNTLLRRLALWAALLSALAVCSHAAPIVWSLAEDITGDSDVSTAGRPVYAVNLGGRVDGKPVNTTINGVTFAGAVTDGVAGVFSWSVSQGKSGWSNNAYAPSYHRLGPIDNLGGAYRLLLQSGIRADNAEGNAGVATLTLRGLTVGRQYQVQIWSNDSGWNENAYARSIEATSPGGHPVSLDANTSKEGAGGLGHYILGSFTATATSQDITFTSHTRGAGTGVLLNAFQLREVGGGSSR